MRLNQRLAVALLSLPMSIGMVSVASSPAQAASACNNNDFVWDLQETVRDGRYVIKNFTARYYTCSRVVVRRTDGRKINVALRIRRDFVAKKKQDTTRHVQVLGRKRVVRGFMTDNVRIDVSVWANLAQRDKLPYRGTTSLKRR